MAWLWWPNRPDNSPTSAPRYPEPSPARAQAQPWVPCQHSERQHEVGTSSTPLSAPEQTPCAWSIPVANPIQHHPYQYAHAHPPQTHAPPPTMAPPRSSSGWYYEGPPSFIHAPSASVMQARHPQSSIGSPPHVQLVLDVLHKRRPTYRFPAPMPFALESASSNPPHREQAATVPGATGSLVDGAGYDQPGHVMKTARGVLANITNTRSNVAGDEEHMEPAVGIFRGRGSEAVPVTGRMVKTMDTGERKGIQSSRSKKTAMNPQQKKEIAAQQKKKKSTSNETEQPQQRQQRKTKKQRTTQNGSIEGTHMEKKKGKTRGIRQQDIGTTSVQLSLDVDINFTNGDMPKFGASGRKSMKSVIPVPQRSAENNSKRREKGAAENTVKEFDPTMLGSGLITDGLPLDCIKSAEAFSKLSRKEQKAAYSADLFEVDPELAKLLPAVENSELRSYYEQIGTNIFERAEHVGDAVIENAVRLCWYYLIPNASPGLAHHVTVAVVCNRQLAVFCRALGLSTPVAHLPPGLSKIKKQADIFEVYFCCLRIGDREADILRFWWAVLARHGREIVEHAIKFVPLTNYKVGQAARSAAGQARYQQEARLDQFEARSQRTKFVGSPFELDLPQTTTLAIPLVESDRSDSDSTPISTSMCNNKGDGELSSPPITALGAYEHLIRLLRHSRPHLSFAFEALTLQEIKDLITCPPKPEGETLEDGFDTSLVASMISKAAIADACLYTMEDLGLISDDSVEDSAKEGSENKQPKADAPISGISPEESSVQRFKEPVPGLFAFINQINARRGSINEVHNLA